MNEQLKKYAAQFDVRPERERALIFFTVVVLICLAGMQFVVTPSLKKVGALETKHLQNRVAMESLANDLQALNLKQSADVDAEIKHQIAEFSKQEMQLRAGLSEYEKKLVPADKMDVVLEAILKQDRSLRLISLKSFPVANVLAPKVSEVSASAASAAAEEKRADATDVQTQEVGLFRHEMEIVVEGNYLNLLAYLKQLEAMPQRLYWNRMQLRVVEYPNSRMTLRVFTLSQENKWLDL